MSDANVSLPDAIPPAPYTPASAPTRHAEGFWGKDGLSFSNLLDVVNPLQHIPVVGSIYRALTGDEISPGARLAGGTLFGGPVGFAAAVANMVVEDAAGIDVGKTAVAMVTGMDAAAPAQVASTATEAARATAAAVPTAATSAALASAGAEPAAPGAIPGATNPAPLQPASLTVMPPALSPTRRRTPSSRGLPARPQRPPPTARPPPPPCWMRRRPTWH